MKSQAFLQVEIEDCQFEGSSVVGIILVYASTFVDRSWHIGDNMSGFSALFSAFDLAFCLVLSSPHGSLPALEDKLGCYP